MSNREEHVQQVITGMSLGSITCTCGRFARTFTTFVPYPKEWAKHEWEMHLNEVANMPMPNIFPHAKDEELKAWNVVVDYSMPKGTLKASPDVFSAIHEFGQRQRSDQFMRDSLLYPDASKMPKPREPFKRAQNGDPDTIVPTPASHKKHPGFPK